MFRIKMKPTYRPLLLLLIFGICGFLSVCAQTREEIPTPKSEFGFKVGADHHLIDYEQSIDYFKKLEETSDRMKLIKVGYTSKKRPWYIAVISTPENLKRLDQIRENNQRIAHPEELSSDEAEELVEDLPVLVDINGGLHASEIAGSQHTNQLAYELLRKDEEGFKELLDNTILFLWPTLNPDGQDIVTDWYREIKNTEYKTAPLHELYQKYIGHDNNRDGFMLNQQESRVLAHTWRRWEPEILHVHHQQGRSSQYSDYHRIWLPPFAPPVGIHTPPRMLREMNALGTRMAMELDTRGFRGATHMGTGYDSYYLGYNDYMEMYHNIVAYWTETDGGQGVWAEPYYVEPDTVLKKINSFRPRALYSSPWKGGWWRLRDQVNYMVGVDYGLLKFASNNRKDILYNRYKSGVETIKHYSDEGPFAYVIPEKQRDRMAAVQMLRRMAFLGIRVERLKKKASIDDTSYPPGTWVIPTDQEFGRLIEEVLGVQSYPKIEQYPDGPLEQPYDVAGWTLSYAMGVQVDAVQEPLSNTFRQTLEPVKGDPVPWKDSKQASLLSNPVAAGIVASAGSISGSGSALVLNPAENNSFTLINRALSEGGKVHFMDKGFDDKSGGHYVVSDIEKATLEDWVDELAIHARWANEASGLDVEQPRIGIYAPWVASIDEGWTRWVFDQYGFKYQRIRNDEMKGGKLTDDYDVIVFASIGNSFRSKRSIIIDGFSSNVMPDSYAGGIGREGVEGLKSFTDNGGKLVFMNKSTAFAIQQFDLPVRNVVRDINRSTFFVGGSILQADINTEEPAMSGMPKKAKIFFKGSPVFKTLDGFKGSVLATYPSKGSLLLSGYLNGGDYLKGRVAAFKADFGKGQMILFGFRPQWRGQTFGTFRMLFNAVLLKE